MSPAFARFTAPARPTPELWRLVLGMGVVAACYFGWIALMGAVASFWIRGGLGAVAAGRDPWAVIALLLRDELDHQLRPPDDQLALLAPRGAREPVDQVPECGTMLFHRELSDNLQVCSNCGHHLPITPRDGSRRCSTAASSPRWRCPIRSADPLQFRDQKKYPDRMKAAQKATGEREAMLVAEGEIGRTPVVAAAQDFAFMGGSMGMYVGNAIIAACERAVERQERRWCCSPPPGARGCRRGS
jgi:hypothetical protein